MVSLTPTDFGYRNIAKNISFICVLLVGSMPKVPSNSLSLLLMNIHRFFSKAVEYLQIESIAVEYLLGYYANIELSIYYRCYFKIKRVEKNPCLKKPISIIKKGEGCKFYSLFFVAHSFKIIKIV